MRYANQDHTIITDGNGTFIPCVLGNSDYVRIVREGLLEAVAPYEAPEEVKTEPTRAEALEAMLIAKGIFSKEEIDGLLD